RAARTADHPGTQRVARTHRDGSNGPTLTSTGAWSAAATSARRTGRVEITATSVTPPSAIASAATSPVATATTADFGTATATGVAVSMTCVPSTTVAVASTLVSISFSI